MTKFQRDLLQAILAVTPNNDTVSIRREMVKQGLNPSYGQLYVELDRLYDEGILGCTEGAGGPERGFRNRVFWHVTEQGRRALEETEE